MVLKPKWWPKLFYGFPVGEEGDAPGAPPRRGLAMIIAIMIISLMMMFATDLIISSQVDLELAVAGRDNLKAEYMAKSAATLGVFLVTADFGLDLFLASPQSPQKTPLTDGPGDIWGMLNGMPIGGDTAEIVDGLSETFSLGKVVDSKVLDQLKLFDGHFTLNVSDEASKININACARGGIGPGCKQVLVMLEGLFSCPPEKLFLERKNLKPLELAYRIKDFADENKNAEPASGLSDEAEPYRRLTPSYNPKNSPFDTVDELKLVASWDEEMHQVFSPYLTVYPFPSGKTGELMKINLNTVPKALLACLIPEARGACAQNFALSLKGRDADKTNLAAGSQAIGDALTKKICGAAAGSGSIDSGSGAAASGEGSKAQWFAANSTVFRIEATGAVGNQEKTINMVIERQVPNPAKQKKESYAIHYWRLD